MGEKWPVFYLNKNNKNERFRQQVNPLTLILGLILLVVCPGDPMEEFVGLGGRPGDGM